MKLISLKNIHEYCTPEQKKLVLAKNQLITPSAKDWLKNQGITIIYSSQKNQVSDSSSHDSIKKSCDSIQSELIAKITTVLISKYKITDKNQLLTLVLEIIKQIH